MRDHPERFIADERLTVDDTTGGVPFTTATVANATYVFGTVETAQIRWLADGTAPTATTGHVADVGGIIELWGAGMIEKFRAIRTGGVSGAIQAQFGA